jgi:hypothetical protein
VIDGQQRLNAARRRSDIDVLPCLIFRTVEESAKDEASKFLLLNTHRASLRAFDKFRAELVAENPDTVFVDRLVSEAKRVPADSARPTTVCCLRELQKLVEKDRAAVTRIWSILVPLCEGYSLHARLLQALFWIEKRMPEEESLCDSRWRKRILLIGYSQLLTAISQSVEYHDSSGPRIFAAGVAKEINKRLRTRRLPVAFND